MPLTHICHVFEAYATVINRIWNFTLILVGRAVRMCEHAWICVGECAGLFYHRIWVCPKKKTRSHPTDTRVEHEEFFWSAWTKKCVSTRLVTCMFDAFLWVCGLGHRVILVQCVFAWALKNVGRTEREWESNLCKRTTDFWESFFVRILRTYWMLTPIIRHACVKRMKDDEASVWWCMRLFVCRARH